MAYDSPPQYAVCLNTAYWSHISGMFMQSYKRHNLPDDEATQVLNLLNGVNNCLTSPLGSWGESVFVGTQFDLWNVTIGTVTSEGMLAVKHDYGSAWSWGIRATFTFPIPRILGSLEITFRDIVDFPSIPNPSRFIAAYTHLLNPIQFLYQTWSLPTIQRTWTRASTDALTYVITGQTSEIVLIDFRAGNASNPDDLLGQPSDYRITEVVLGSWGT